MVSDHRAFFIEKREVNDKKKIERRRSLKQWLSFIRTTMFSKYRNQSFFKKRKKEEIQVGLSTRDLLWFILPKEGLDFLKRYKRY